MLPRRMPALLVTGVLLLAATTISAKEEREPRLKFRDKGPTCMCVGGLSEEDIRRAQRRKEESGALRDSQGFERLDGAESNIEKERGGKK